MNVFRVWKRPTTRCRSPRRPSSYRPRTAMSSLDPRAGPGTASARTRRHRPGLADRYPTRRPATPATGVLRCWAAALIVGAAGRRQGRRVRVCSGDCCAPCQRTDWHPLHSYRRRGSRPVVVLSPTLTRRGGAHASHRARSGVQEGKSRCGRFGTRRRVRGSRSRLSS